MVDIIQLEPDVAVAAQLAEADFKTVAARGFRSVVAIRPDATLLITGKRNGRSDGVGGGVKERQGGRCHIGAVARNVVVAEGEVDVCPGGAGERGITGPAALGVGDLKRLARVEGAVAVVTLGQCGTGT